MFAQYRKFLVALAGVATAVGTSCADGEVSTVEIGLMATALATAVGVVLVPNEPPVE